MRVVLVLLGAAVVLLAQAYVADPIQREGTRQVCDAYGQERGWVLEEWSEPGYRTPGTCSFRDASGTVVNVEDDEVPRSFSYHAWRYGGWILTWVAALGVLSGAALLSRRWKTR